MLRSVLLFMKWIALSRTSISRLMFSLHLSSNNFLSNSLCIALFMSMVIGLPALFFLTASLASTACIDRISLPLIAKRNVSITLRHLGEKFRLQEETRRPLPAAAAGG